MDDKITMEDREQSSTPPEEIKIEDITESFETPELDEEIEGASKILTLKEEGDDNKGSIGKDSSPAVPSSGTIYIPQNQVVKKVIENEVEDDEEEFEDETLAERLWGLTEMFPEKVRDVTWTLSTSTISCASGLYNFSRSALWIIATSAIILAAPVLIENEKTQLEEMSRQQQRQILLGPGAAPGGLSPSMPPQPPR